MITNKLLLFIAGLLLIQTKPELSEDERKSVLDQFDELARLVKDEQNYGA